MVLKHPQKLFKIISVMTKKSNFKSEIYLNVLRTLRNYENEEVRLHLFSTLLPYGYKTVYEVLHENFKYIPVDMEDFHSAIYLVFDKTLRWFINQQSDPKCFLTYFACRLKLFIIAEFRRYITNGQLVLNFANEIGEVVNDTIADDDQYDFNLDLKIWEAAQLFSGVYRQIFL